MQVRLREKDLDAGCLMLQSFLAPDKPLSMSASLNEKTSVMSVRGQCGHMDWELVVAQGCDTSCEMSFLQEDRSTVRTDFKQTCGKKEASSDELKKAGRLAYVARQSSEQGGRVVKDIVMLP